MKIARTAVMAGACLLMGCLFCLTTQAGAEALDAAPEALQEYLARTKWQGDLDKMVERREIRVLVVPSKTFFFLDKGVQRGMTHDLMREFEAYLNAKLRTGTRKVKVVFLPVRRDQLMEKLVAGYGDIAAANLTVTAQRRGKVDFSEPFAAGIKEVVVTQAGERPMTGYDDLAGREVYVRKSSSYYESLVVLNRLFGKTGREPVKIVAAAEVLEDEDLLEMLNAGLLTTLIIDSHKAAFWAGILPNIQVHEDASVRSDAEIAWAIRQNSPRLKSLVDDFARRHRKGTLIGNMLINRYLKNIDYITNSTTGKEMEKFREMVDLFKKYAGQYNFDYLLLGAQAYQESRLDQSKKSPAGAIGVMQLLPSTARDPVVGIPDIHVLENNIHAGTKYLRFIADRYFADAAIDPVDRMLFSFAAYNAGPAKINRVRERTAKMGLDPNVWFQNAEVAAAEMIGRETVQYVGNIYKYYLAYSMALAHMNAKQEQKTPTEAGASQ